MPSVVVKCVPGILMSVAVVSDGIVVIIVFLVSYMVGVPWREWGWTAVHVILD